MDDNKALDKKTPKKQERRILADPTNIISDSDIVLSTRFNDYSFRKGNFIVFIFASLLNGMSTLKGKNLFQGE